MRLSSSFANSRTWIRKTKNYFARLRLCPALERHTKEAATSEGYGTGSWQSNCFAGNDVSRGSASRSQARRQQATCAPQGISEPHSDQHRPAHGVMNMLALQQADLLPHVLQVVNHGNLTSLNAAPVTLHEEAHGIDADFFTLPAKLRCPANMTRTNQANWLALAASSCAGELLSATDISACRWHAASFSHPFLCHLAAHQNSSWQISLCHPSSTDLCAIRGCKTALAACPLLQERHPKLRRTAIQRISCRLAVWL